jgi:hypothetical protein
MLDAGALAVQSMPLITTCGHPIGVLSTHWHQRRRPGEQELRLLALVERLTGRYLECEDGEALTNGDRHDDDQDVAERPDLTRTRLVLLFPPSPD